MRPQGLCARGGRAREVSATGVFLAEKYLPPNEALDLVAVVDHDRAAARMASIRHLRTTYAPADETCFSLFEAPSLETIQGANDRFRLGYRRVTAVLEIQSTAGNATHRERCAVIRAVEDYRNESSRTEKD
jgi:hypothetical protein